MSELKLENCWAPLPIPERGYGMHLYAGGKADQVLYCHKSHVVMRSLEDPTKSVIYSGHKSNVNVARFAPSGGWVASGDSTGKVLVWPAKPNGDGEYTIKSDIPINTSVLDLAWSEDSKRIVAVGDGNPELGQCVSWDSGNTIGNVVFHSKRMLSCDFKPSRPYRIATTSEDLQVGFFEGPPFKVNVGACNKDHTRYPNKVKFSNSGERYITVGSDSKIQVFEGKTGEKLKELVSKDNGHKAAIYSFDWNDAGDKILTVSADKTAKIWNVDAAEGADPVETTFVMGNTTDDMQMGCVWHKNWIVTVSLCGRMTFLDPANPDKPARVLEGHSGSPTCASLHRATGVLFTGDDAGHVSVWREGNPTWLNGKGHSKGIRAIAANHDGTKVFSCGADDNMLTSEVKTGEFGTDAVALGGAPSCMCAGSKSDTVVVGVAQGKLVVVSEGKVSESLAITYKPLSIAMSPDESEVSVGGQDKKVHVYKLEGGKLTEDTKVTKTDHSRSVDTVNYSADGRYMVSAGGDNCIKVWEGPSTEQKNPSNWSFHTSMVTSVAFSPDGKRCASVSKDTNLYIFTDCETFKSDKKRQLVAHDRDCVFVDWLDNDRVLTIGSDGVVKTWIV